ncbi:hypothetical protein [Aliarcobacter skirrowii]|uniref:gp53-like domain-containing protein n=1 Tax=Aliarcobacter skirrowii TaxID=28200 RepID=UPI002A3598E4|nr:hypothetical protein [Aliarcobacter skirrowii]MDY0179723.1 hypothetical protein [Aliarcobacter skirrowii]
MGINFLLPIIAGIVMTIMVGAQVAPSIVDNIKAKKVEYATINNQDMIFEATKRYITLTQTNPSSINDLINGGFLDSTKNNNGFGGTYTISVDGTKGILTTSTKIDDPTAQKLFLKSFNNKNTPTQISGTSNFETKYILPTSLMHGSGLFMNGIPVQATAPDKIKYKYWYDSSGTKVILKMSDGTNWKEVQLVGDDNVKLSGNQTIAGVKTFSSSPIVPTPTTNTQVANKQYVDSKVGTEGNLSENGWTKLPNGLILQWGKIFHSGGWGWHRVYFPIPFPNKVFSITSSFDTSPTFGYGSGDLWGTYPTETRDIEKHTFRITMYANGAYYMYWFAIGY